MGRSYLFECPKCGYKTKVSGRAERGVHFSVQTILCRDCREVYDAVTALKVPADPRSKSVKLVSRSRLSKADVPPEEPPEFEAVLNRLSVMSAKRFTWIQFKLRCPVSPEHRVEAWNDPDRCPRCGVFLEKNSLPFRLWE